MKIHLSRMPYGFLFLAVLAPIVYVLTKLPEKAVVGLFSVELNS